MWVNRGSLNKNSFFSFFFFLEKKRLVHTSITFFLLTDAPEVKNMSSCSREADMMKCVCIVESNPPSTVHFLLSDRVFPSTNIENHGSVTIGSLQTELGANEFILCLANNTEGNANLTLIVFVNSKVCKSFLFSGMHNVYPKHVTCFVFEQKAVHPAFISWLLLEQLDFSWFFF